MNRRLALQALLAFAAAAPDGYPGFETYAWFGMLAPAGVPDQIVSRLNGELLRALALPGIRSAFAARGVEPLPSTPEEFAAFIRSEISKYAKVIKQANVSLD